MFLFIQDDPLLSERLFSDTRVAFGLKTASFLSKKKKK